VGYDVWGEFMLNGIAVNATSPIFFGFIFDQPTTDLPLPQVALFPRPGSVPRQGLYVATNIAVRTVPEPSTISLLICGLIVVLAASTRSMRSRRPPVFK
ncbi:MAG TPA: PEP-CTERM sorting domain-containing protein, partial [Vicinamibacterales bacterium]|nr:PEP-CTERM sorting domain-containing protein [Vicinamibacterales bacterium]